MVKEPGLKFKMRVAIILGPFSISSRPLDFWYENIWISSRGLSGTDLCFVKTAQELSSRGHEVHAFTVHAQPHHKPDSWSGVKLYNFEDRMNVVDDSFDCIISINEPNILIGMSEKPLKIVWQMLNDFSFVQPGFDEYVDQYLGVCEEHTQYLKERNPSPHKWDTLSLGCSPELYKDQRIPGRVVWCSSADRGLHWLLSQWPQIRAAVPYATLKIFYHFSYGEISKIEPSGTNSHPHVVEMGQRIRYIQHTIGKLKSFGVEHIGSVSRVQMQEEFSKASAFGFSCDTVAFSEGFSVSTLEAHASFTVPVITSQDCLGGIYKDSGAIVVPSPVKDHLPEFTSMLIKSLTDDKFANDVIDKCRKFAHDHTWAASVEKLENIILNHPKVKDKLNGQ